MKFEASLIVVNDVQKSREFYEKVLNQTVRFDFGENIMFDGGFSIQLKPHFAKMVRLEVSDISQGSNSFELYFEEDDFDGFVRRLGSISGIQYLHDVVEHPWGQRVVRFYDPDKHIIEVSESMENVVKRFLEQGLSVSETAARTQYPVEFVEHLAQICK